jgi:hypothetical protein
MAHSSVCFAATLLTLSLCLLLPALHAALSTAAPGAEAAQLAPSPGPAAPPPPAAAAAAAAARLAWVVVGPATEAYAVALRSTLAGGNPCSGPGAAVLCYFSTWQDEGASPVALAYAAANFTLVLSQPPAHPGWHNVNLQLTSSHAGLRAAAAAGATHALKMRGDVHVTSAAALLAVVTPSPPRLTIVSWIRYLTEYLVAGPMALMLELFGAQQAASDDRFAELFMMEAFAARRNWSHQALCRSTARWADASGRPAGGAQALPEGLLYWKCAGGSLAPACDLAVGLRRYVAPGDACDGLLPPGCHHAC